MVTSSELLRAKRSRQMVRFSHRFEDNAVRGFVVDVGPVFFLLLVVSDRLWFDGFECFRASDIRKLEADPYARFAETALRKRGERKPSVCSEREAAVPLSRETKISGGCLPSLTLTFGQIATCFAMTPQIYADFNGYRRGDDVDWVELDTFGTLKDLHFHQIVLREGLEIMVWDLSDESEDMELVGKCHYHAGGRAHWCVHAPHGALRYVPRHHKFTRDFICFSCRQPLPDLVRQPQQGTCCTCGLSIHYPWAAPSVAVS